MGLVGRRKVDSGDTLQHEGSPKKSPTEREERSPTTAVEDEALASARQALELEAEAIQALVNRIDERFAFAVELIETCQGRVVVTGMGKSGLIGKKIAATLASTGTLALFLHPAEGVHGDLGMLARGDLVLALSNSGETEELLALIPTIKRLGISIVVLTGNVNSELAKYGDAVLDTSVREEACPMNLTPTASTTAALALGDALAIAVLTRRGFEAEDFARLHPGGTLGKTLKRVEELMHPRPEVPIVQRTAGLNNVLNEMSTKRLGATAVVDEGGVLVGIVTDGDLRRALQSENPLQANAEGLMTHSPRTISRRHLAVEALDLMERNSIAQLLVVDSAGCPIGMIHLHDLLRAQIV